jgi:hypothetical protein
LRLGCLAPAVGLLHELVLVVGHQAFIGERSIVLGFLAHGDDVRPEPAARDPGRG